MRPFNRLLSLLMLPVLQVTAAEPVISESLRQAAKNAAMAQPSAEMQARAERLDALVRSQAWQARQAKYMDGQTNPTNPTNPTNQDTEDQGATIEPQQRVVMFVSQSIPLKTLRRYAKDMETIGGIMILRGGVQGLKAFRPTMEFIAEILRVDSDCRGYTCRMRKVDVLIDPILFRSNDITAVPAVTYFANFDLRTYCQRGTESKPLPKALLTLGDAALSGHLAELYRQTGDNHLGNLLQRLEHGS